jgi:hypothetical protein
MPIFLSPGKVPAPARSGSPGHSDCGIEGHGPLKQEHDRQVGLSHGVLLSIGNGGYRCNYIHQVAKRGLSRSREGGSLVLSNPDRSMNQ